MYEKELLGEKFQVVDQAERNPFMIAKKGDNGEEGDNKNKKKKKIKKKKKRVSGLQRLPDL
jgi:hypothetical protein